MSDITITKERIIKDIAKSNNAYNIDMIRKIYNDLERHIKNDLSLTNLEQNVKIKLFEGVVIESRYTPEKVKVNNLTGQPMTVSSRIRPKIHITRAYREKINHGNE